MLGFWLELVGALVLRLGQVLVLGLVLVDDVVSSRETTVNQPLKTQTY